MAEKFNVKRVITAKSPEADGAKAALSVAGVQRTLTGKAAISSSAKGSLSLRETVSTKVPVASSLTANTFDLAGSVSYASTVPMASSATADLTDTGQVIIPPTITVVSPPGGGKPIPYLPSYTSKSEPLDLVSLEDEEMMVLL